MDNKTERKIVRLPWIEENRGMTAKMVERAILKDGFPAPMKLSDRSKGFWLHEVDEWFEHRPRGLKPCKGEGQYTDEAIEEQQRKRAVTMAANREHRETAE